VLVAPFLTLTPPRSPTLPINLRSFTFTTEMLLSFINLVPLLAVFTVTAVNAQSESGQTCNATSPCSSDAPCCSEFGFCGSDDYCLGGCNPLFSHSLDSCLPNPVCESAKYTFADNSRILSNATLYNGNASAYDWTLDKGTIMNTNSSGGELGLLLTQDNGGSRISSTKYIHYGTITTTMKTGRWAGVVTAFITMSNIKDEIDWEFPGNTTTEAQTNYFWQGVIAQPTHGEVEQGLTDTFSNYHDFTVDWKADSLTFLVDGKAVRTIKESDTVVNGVSQFPNTPSRIQLSIWPAGISSSPPGVVQWAGGMINWNDPDYTSAGHFYALVKSVSVQCGDPQKPGANITSYTYGQNTSTDTPGIAFSNESTIDAAYTISAVNSQLHVVLAIVVGLVIAFQVLV
jgi:beta-glucanase (GH16 family)